MECTQCRRNYAFQISTQSRIVDGDYYLLQHHTCRHAPYFRVFVCVRVYDTQRKQFKDKKLYQEMRKLLLDTYVLCTCYGYDL